MLSDIDNMERFIERINSDSTAKDKKFFIRNITYVYYRVAYIIFSIYYIYMSYNWVSPDGGGEGSALVEKANLNAALKKLDDGSEEYNLMTDLYNQLDKCMQQNHGFEK